MHIQYQLYINQTAALLIHLHIHMYRLLHLRIFKSAQWVKHHQRFRAHWAMQILFDFENCCRFFFINFQLNSQIDDTTFQRCYKQGYYECNNNNNNNTKICIALTLHDFMSARFNRMLTVHWLTDLHIKWFFNFTKCRQQTASRWAITKHTREHTATRRRRLDWVSG